MNTSVTYGQNFDANADFEEASGIGDQAYNLVFSADVALAPGLVLAGDVSQFDNDCHGRHRHRRHGLDRGRQRPPRVLIAARAAARHDGGVRRGPRPAAHRSGAPNVAALHLVLSRRS